MTAKLNATYTLHPNDIHRINGELLGGRCSVGADGLYLADPLTGQPLEPCRVPPSVTQTPSLNRGLNYLQERGNRGCLSVQLLLGPHWGEEDFDLFLAQYGHLIADASLVGVEVDWISSESPERVQPHQVELLLPRSGPARAFRQAQIAWLCNNGTTMLPCEMADNCESELARALNHLWYGVYKSITSDRYPNPGMRNAARTIVANLYEAVRHWVILGQLGWWLQRLDESGSLPNEHLTVPVMLGRRHEYSLHRLKVLDVPAEKYLVTKSADTEEYEAYREATMQSTLNMHVPTELLRTHRPF